MTSLATLVRVLLCLSGGVVLAAAQEPAARVRAAILSDPEQPWIGQRIVLRIELLAPGYFAGASKFDFPQIPGVLIVPPGGSPVLGTEQDGGQSDTVQAYDVSLIAREEGVHRIPPFRIRFAIKRSPLDAQEVPQSVSPPPLAFTARRPSGAQGRSFLLSSRDFAVRETWRPSVGKGKTGDAFVRTITFTASDLPGMAFPPFSSAAVDGMSIYSREPVLSAGDERGALSGSRRDTRVYVCEHPGRFVVPAARLTWWNPGDQTFHTAELPERVLEIVGNPALPGGRENGFGSLLARSLGAGGLFLAVLAAAGIVWRAVPGRFWARTLDSLRPVHLAPMNPIPPAEARREGTCR